MLGYFLDTLYLSYTCLSNCLSLEYYDTDINPKLLILSRCYCYDLSDHRKWTDNYYLLFVCKKESEIPSPVSIETNSDTTCKHSVLASLVRLQY